MEILLGIVVLVWEGLVWLWDKAEANGNIIAFVILVVWVSNLQEKVSQLERRLRQAQSQISHIKGEGDVY